MRYDRKFNRYERRDMQKAQMQKALEGHGLYLFENHTQADLTLPRPTKSGRRVIKSGEQFQGDDYYMSLVKTGFCRLIKVLQTPQQEAAALAASQQALLENHSQETPMNEQKLILDQPATIKESGQVEHVAGSPSLGKPQKLNESGKGGKAKAQPDVLINESPVSGGFVIVED